MRYLNLFLIVLILLPAIVSGQSASWHYLPNNSFTKGTGDTASRIEDICFTDTLTGYAVTLTNKLYKTTDGGISWQLKNDTQKMVLFRSIDFLDDGMTGLAGALGAAAPAFLYTDDGGNAWTDISNTVTDTSKKNPKNICGLAHWGNTFYGVGSWGSKTAKFYKSTDKGKTWTTKYIDQSLATGLVDVVFISQDTGFVTGTHDHTMSVILKTTDGGDTWQRVFKDTVLGGLIWKIQFVNKSIAVGSIENVFLRDSVNMVRSNDGGNTWSIIAVGNMKGKNNFSGGTQAVGFATPLKGWVGGYYNGIF